MRRYLSIIKFHGIISQTRLAYEAGDSRDAVFREVIDKLAEAGCIKVITNSADFVRMKGLDWMNQQMISPNFKKAPVLYEFIKDLPP